MEIDQHYLQPSDSSKPIRRVSTTIVETSHRESTSIITLEPPLHRPSRSLSLNPSNDIDHKGIVLQMLSIAGEELSQLVIQGPINIIFKSYQPRIQLSVITDPVRRGSLIEDYCTACFEGNLSKIQYMIKIHTDLINAKNKQGQTCLYCASRAGKLDIVKELLEVRGVDINLAVDSHGGTPLHAASFGGHPNIVSYLLTHGADYERKNVKGLTPKDEAVSVEVRNVWQLFREGSLEKSNYPISKAKISLDLERLHHLIQHFCHDKTALSLEAKVHLIITFQKMDLHEDIIWKIIDSITDKEFKLFKTALDNISDLNNLHNLCYRYFSKRYQELMFNKVKLMDSIPGNMGRRPIKILSDIDDTFVCSGGTFGNVDTSYPKDINYPGVNTFYKELDLGPYSVNGEWPKDRYGNLAFISARPKVDAAKQIEISTYEKFTHLVSEGKLYTFPTLLCGNVKGITGAVVGDFLPMAKKKLKNFEQYLVLYPEFDFVFVGDNGQGDALVAATMLLNYPTRVKAAFIHQVQDRAFGQTDTPEWNKIRYFKNYVDAATYAYQDKLIHFKGLQRILCEARKEFDSIPWLSESQKRKVADQFETSCSNAHKIVVKATKVNKTSAAHHRQKKVNAQ